MHELSLAQNILEIIHQHVPQEHLQDVRSVRIKVGALAGVVPESLEFSYNAIIAETPLAHSTLEIRSLPFVLLCNQCGRTTSRESGVAVCEECESNDTKILSGTELHVVEIELLDG